MHLPIQSSRIVSVAAAPKLSCKVDVSSMDKYPNMAVRHNQPNRFQPETKSIFQANKQVKDASNNCADENQVGRFDSSSK